MPTENKEQVEAAARKVQEKGVDAVLAKLGTKGSMLIQKDEVLNQSILKADKVTFHQLTYHMGLLTAQYLSLQMCWTCSTCCWDFGSLTHTGHSRAFVQHALICGLPVSYMHIPAWHWMLYPECL